MPRYFSNIFLARTYVKLITENEKTPPSKPRPTDFYAFSEWIQERRLAKPRWFDRLTTYFPEFEPEVLLQVINHALKPEDIWQLDIRRLEYRGTEYPQTGDQGTDYGSLDLVVAPMTNYFRILQRAAVLSGSYIRAWYLGFDSLRYLGYLMMATARDPWNVVLNNHLNFHRNRLVDMACDDQYRVWGIMDEAWKSNHLDEQ